MYCPPSPMTPRRKLAGVLQPQLLLLSLLLLAGLAERVQGAPCILPGCCLPVLPRAKGDSSASPVAPALKSPPQTAPTLRWTPACP